MAAASIWYDPHILASPRAPPTPAYHPPPPPPAAEPPPESACIDTLPTSPMFSRTDAVNWSANQVLPSGSAPPCAPPRSRSRPLPCHVPDKADHRGAACQLLPPAHASQLGRLAPACQPGPNGSAERRGHAGPPGQPDSTCQEGGPCQPDGACHAPAPGQMDPSGHHGGVGND